MTTRLLEAVERSDAAAVRDIVAQNPDAAGARDADGVSALLLARYGDAHDVVAVLRPAVPTLDVFEAAALGDTARLEELLDAEPALVDAWSADGFTPLHLAAFFGNDDAVDVLLARGADVEAVSRNALGVRPLNSAAAAGERRICERLLTHGADVETASHGGFTPLHAAAQNGDVELVRLLLDHGADAAATTDDGQTPLDYAHERGRADAAALLTAHLGF